ncbi:inner centromere protein-like [Littorina saxatilis]|uniref:inner centromere protein-like n=1 Tax=Littorina saxatilis TaxID=31220 RepID=UPI0038B44408
MAVEQPQRFRISDDKNENEDDKAQHVRVAALRRQIQMEELIRRKLRQQFAMEEEQSLKERLKELRQQRLDSLKQPNTQKSSPGGFQNDHDEDEEDKARKVRLAALRRQVQMEEVNARQQRRKELGKQDAVEEERMLEEKLRELQQQRLGALHTARGSSCRHSLINPDGLPFRDPAAVTRPSFVSNQAYNDLLPWNCDFCLVTNMRFSTKCFGWDAERPHTHSTGERSESMTDTDTQQTTATSLRLDHPSSEGNTGFIPPSLDTNGNPFSISRDQNHDRQQKYDIEYIAVTNLFKNLFLERREVPGVFVFGQQTSEVPSTPALFSFQHS